MVAKTIRGDNTGATDEVFQYEESGVGGVFFWGGPPGAEPSTPSTFSTAMASGSTPEKVLYFTSGQLNPP